jgi:predicted phage gp36 major capsid-like protein
MEAEQQRRKYERDAKKLAAEMLRRAESRDRDNQRREAELEWVTGDDGQPLFPMGLSTL